jgi:uncharacterized OB-fold protein
MSFTVRPTPNPEGLNAEFYAWCAREELRVQRCSACGTWRHPPCVVCARCNSDAWSWERASGPGRVYTWKVTHQALVPGWAEEVPYAVAVVELEEGVRLVSAVREVAPRDLRIGMAVKVGFVKASDTVGLHWFRPA